MSDGAFTSRRWSTPIVFLNTPGSYQKPQLRATLEVPSNANTVVGADQLDIVVIENGVEIRYVSTREPLDGAQPTTPPDHTYTSDSTPTFSWSRLSSDDALGGTTYHLQVSTTPLFTGGTLVDDTNNINGTSRTVTTPLADGAYYYWRVAATNSHGTGPWGPIYELGVDTSQPSAFSLTSPADGEDPGTKTPTFIWQAATD